jgi:hypothetical protein
MKPLQARDDGKPCAVRQLFYQIAQAETPAFPAVPRKSGVNLYSELPPRLIVRARRRFGFAGGCRPVTPRFRCF